jgi:hypothetical protein
MDAIEAEEHHLLELRSRRAAQSARVTFGVVIGGAGLLLFILLWSMRTIRRDLTLRASITAALRESEEHHVVWERQSWRLDSRSQLGDQRRRRH